MPTVDNNYFVDFSLNQTLTQAEKDLINEIQERYKPMERVDLLLEFRNNGKITEDEFEQMTGVPYIS